MGSDKPQGIKQRAIGRKATGAGRVGFADRVRSTA